jgi:Uncharacterised nucleotidyltransferase
MRERDLRVLTLAALRPVPDFSRLSLLHHSNASQIRKLLRWLDESGLSLYLFTQLQDHKVLGQVPEDLSAALESRLAANQVRTAAMLSEFARLVDSFRGNGVQFCALKGFTLTPEFCREVHLRHQTDFDFLVSPDSFENAKSAMQSCGYEQGEIAEPGEVTFATPLRHIPTANDDIYAIPRHREVDLLTTLRLSAHGVSIPMPTPDFNDLKTKILLEIAFPALPSEEMFCLQVMHAFRHLLGSWVRVSWLFEIGYFIDRHYGDEDLWRAIVVRMGRDAGTRNAFGLVISLTRALFPRPIPEPLAEWCLQSLPPRIETWVAHFSVKTAIADLDGAKFTLFVHREFVHDRAFWTSYVKGRIFPIGGRSSIGRVAITDTGTRIKAKVSQWRHTMRRSIFHARSLFSLPVEAIRFRYALRSIERQRVLVAEALTR